MQLALWGFTRLSQKGKKNALSGGELQFSPLKTTNLEVASTTAAILQTLWRHLPFATKITSAIPAASNTACTRKILLKKRSFQQIAFS